MNNSTHYVRIFIGKRDSLLYSIPIITLSPNKSLKHNGRFIKLYFKNLNKALFALNILLCSHQVISLPLDNLSKLEINIFRNNKYEQN